MKLTKLQLNHKGVSIDYNYCLVITSLQELQQYLSELEQKYKNSLANAIGLAKDRYNHNAPLGIATYYKGLISGKSLASSFIDVTNGAVRDKMRAIEKYGKIYIQGNLMSYMPTTEGLIEVGEPVFINTLSDWPVDETTVRIVRLEGGYGIKCGNKDIIIDNQISWDTSLDACKAFNAWWREQRQNELFGLL